MSRDESTEPARLEDLDDTALVERAREGDPAAFWLIIKRHNQRLYRVARAVLDDDAEAEDVVQETYVQAFTHLAGFRGHARLSTWLTRIALNEALHHRRRRRPTVGVEAIENMPASSGGHRPNPEEATAIAEIRGLLERAILGLPAPFRLVFVMRDVEEMSVEETALLLGLRPQTVKTRLYRARRLLREELRDRLAAVFTDTFPFAAARCDRLSQSVLDRLGIELSRASG